jgi:hypothetical protein
MLNVAFASLTGRKKFKDRHVFNSGTQAVVETR